MPSTDESKVAVLMDFENIAMGAKRAQYKDFDVHIVLRRLLDKGKIVDQGSPGDLINSDHPLVVDFLKEALSAESF